MLTICQNMRAQVHSLSLQKYAESYSGYIDNLDTLRMMFLPVHSNMLVQRMRQSDGLEIISNAHSATPSQSLQVLDLGILPELWAKVRHRRTRTLPRSRRCRWSRGPPRSPPRRARPDLGGERRRTERASRGTGAWGALPELVGRSARLMTY